MLMQMFNWGEAYRLFAYLNLLLVLIYVVTQQYKAKGFYDKKTLIYIFSIPLGFIAIHFLASANLVIIKEIRHILLAAFLATGVWLLAKRNHGFIKDNILGFTLVLILIYVAVQVVALWWFNKPYGTTKNPHYLALYSSILLIVSTYIFFKVSTRLKWLIATCILLLGILLLHTSSRPTWIGLIVSGSVVLIFLNRRVRTFSTLAMIAVLIGLTLTNAGNFAARFGELLVNIKTEERVVIWQDAWKMQMESPPVTWIFGHGLDTFKEGFKHYSQYHMYGLDYNSPHNFPLELLYLSGIAGVLLSTLMVGLTYKNLYLGIKNQVQYKNIYLALMAVFTSNLILVSITLPFFTSYNLNVIAIVTGVMLYLKEISLKKSL
jgi:O-antigen ligase